MNRLLSLVCWALASIVLVMLITLPISHRAHLVTAILLLAIMILIKTFRPDGIWRLMFLAFGTTIVLRYAFWRTTGTLPPTDQLANFIPGIMLYGAEMYSIIMLGLSLFVVIAPLKPRPQIPFDPDEVLPTVDVFVPSYNEEVHLLAGTLAAAKAMDYPADKLTVWLLDDGSTRAKRESKSLSESAAANARHLELQKLCNELDVRYLTRDHNEHAKAGNLNNGLEHSNAELVAVFDADHAPARDFLQWTVPHFERDHKLFLVQTPHFFLNPDPLERNLRTFERMPSENEMFYGIIQRGQDKWNASFFCGSAAVLRREALESVNGFSGTSITEDCETALDLHARGWTSVYIDQPLIAGLQPATFASFIGQRTRWAQGMVQIMLTKSPLFKLGLSLGQRLCYLSSVLFWLFPINRAIFLFAPLFYIIFDLQIFTASNEDFVAYTVTYLLANLIMQNYLFGRWRWPWISELYEYIQSVHLLPALLSVLLNPKKPTFNVTAKDETTLHNRVSEIGMPFYIIFFILLIGVGFTVYRLMTDPYKAGITMVVGGWNLFNLIIAGCALGVVSERREARQSRRVAIERDCEVRNQEGTWVPGIIEDVSSTGIGIALPSGRRQFNKDTPTAVRFTPYSEIANNELDVDVRNVATTDTGVILGCQFALNTPNDYRLMADLLYANSSKWSEQQESRRVNIGIIMGTVRFLLIALFQTNRGLAYLVRFGNRPISQRARRRSQA